MDRFYTSIGPRLTSVALALLAAGCGEALPPPEVVPLECPAGPGSRAARLDGSAERALLSWLEGAGEGTTLRCAELGPGGWGSTCEVARGADLATGWSEAPCAAALPDGSHAAVFARSQAAAPGESELWCARSLDGGATWSEPALLQERRANGSHGGASVAALDGGHWLAAWLEDEGLGADGKGGTALVARTLARDGALGPRTVLDPRVCDGCRTASAQLGEGEVLVAYRDRSPFDVRDVALVSFTGGRAGEPRVVARDGWRSAGCPDNGPALAVRGDEVAVAWFTLGVDNVERVLATVSHDRGASFPAARRVSLRPTDGLVGCAFDARGSAWVSFLERVDRSRAEWVLAPAIGGAAPLVLGASVPGRAAGFAQLAARGERLLFARQVSGAAARIECALVLRAGAGPD